MSENKFIKHLKGKQAVGSLVEIKNQSTQASFGNMPIGTSDSTVEYSDHRENVTVVANGTTNWKVSNSDLLLANNVYGDGQDFTSTYSVSGAGLWVNSTYTFPSTGDVNHPIAMIFNPNSKWVLKLCGDNLIVDNGSEVELSLVISFGVTEIISKQFTIKEQANQFCKELVIDFEESNTNLIKAQGLSTMKVQVLCGTPGASARIYNGMTVFTVLQRKVDAAVVSGTFANVEEALRDGILPSDYFNNAAFISQIEDGDSAYAVFTRDGDTVALSGWAQPIPDQSGNSGKFLTTDGSLMSWEQLAISNIDGLQTELTDLQNQIDDVSGRGHFLALWNCVTGLAETNPPESPYTYQAGDYFIVSVVSSATPAVNYKPDGSSYTTGVASTTVETNEVSVNDTYFYDGTTWKLQANSQRTYTFAGIAGSPYDNTALGNALNDKVNETSTANQVYGTDNNGDQTTYDISDLGPGDFTGATAGDAGTNGLVPAPAAGDQAKFLQGDGTWGNPTAATAWGNITGTLSNQTDLQSALNAKQDTLTAGTNISITGTTISATDTTYTGSNGITLTGTNFTNSGVRSVATGTTSGTISVNTNGTSADVAVNGWSGKADVATTLAGYGITDGAKINSYGDISAPNNLISNNGINIINGNVERGVAPSADTFKDIRYQDKNGKWLAGFEHAVHTDKTSEISMILSDMVNDTGNIAGSIVLAQYLGGVVVATCPASGTTPNSILTNVACSIGGSGYVKFGNGLIIQWGGVQGLGWQQAQWVGLPTPFSTNNYSVVITPSSNGLNYTQSAFVPNQLYTTGFDVTTGINGGTSQSLWCRWIAIGY